MGDLLITFLRCDVQTYESFAAPGTPVTNRIALRPSRRVDSMTCSMRSDVVARFCLVASNVPEIFDGMTGIQVPRGFDDGRRSNPTPTIIEAARDLYARHTVEEIRTFDATKQNLATTSERIEQVIESTRREGRKAILFVTGVPGAGKTLVGLDVATKKRDEQVTHAVFLSGNGPLVRVLREALLRDEVKRRRAAKDWTRRGALEQPIKQFIQNVHHFRDEGLNREAAPSDHVVIFDEAQRAWNQRETARFMKQRKGRPGFTLSEPELLLSYMDRHDDWALVVCLVGGGQEINRGEAGISAWLDAVSTRHVGWQVYISPNLSDSE